ncbi:hypothetical protein KS4_05970 [Poriferisphaera corsica]|uniref:Uncharacterized protein n=1 Tax=Poriferisphaera corsica TaxID=2528020 RepID=A0A517YQU0_9BACT|nr:hypothetical protein KS4_05970 [Poriferisphaera corsica]
MSCCLKACRWLWGGGGIVLCEGSGDWLEMIDVEFDEDEREG